MVFELQLIELCYLHLILQISTLYPIVNLLHQTTCSLQKCFYKTNNKTPKLKAAIEKADINIFHQYFNNSLEDPVKLQELVLFYLCFHCRAEREGWKKLQKEHLKILTGAENHRYVTIDLPERIENNTGGCKQSSQDYSNVRMYEIGSHSLDPVNALEFYLQKLHPGNPNLFDKCKKLFSKVDGIWRTKEVIGKKHSR